METEAAQPQDRRWWMRAFIWAINISSSVLSSYLSVIFGFSHNRMFHDCFVDTYVSLFAELTLLDELKQHVLFSQ